MPRILHIIPSLAVGGTARQAAILAAMLPRNEFDIHLGALHDAGESVSIEPDLRRVGVKPVVFGCRGAVDLVAFWRLRRFIQKLKPDVVHTWLFAANSVGRLAALSCGVRRLIASERRMDAWKLEHEWFLDRTLARRTSRIVCNSSAVREFHLRRGLPAERFTMIPSGVEPVETPGGSRTDLLHQLKLPENALLLAFAGPLARRKRLKELIWATDQLRPSLGLPAHLVVIGAGPMRPALERYARLNHVQHHVHFLGPRNDVSQILRHCQVFWQAGAHEGQSLAVLEAMAAGMPIVAANAAGNRELVIDGETGFLVPLDERAGFARCTLPLLDNPELAHRLGAAGKRRVEQFFRLQDLAALRYAELYRDVLG